MPNIFRRSAQDARKGTSNNPPQSRHQSSQSKGQQSRPSLVTPGKGPSRRNAALASGGGQLFLQRPNPSHRAQSMSQGQTKSHQKIQKQRAVPPQGQLQEQQQEQQEPANATGPAISMEEVLADLQVVEQQQRESQRKLQSALLTKDHRVKQRNDLGSQLQELKFTNGGHRAQLKQYRELLSVGTRDLGDRSLDGGSIDDGIREREKKLKKGLYLARLTDMRVKILENQFTKLDSLLVELEKEDRKLGERTKKISSELQQLADHENMLRKKIREHNASFRKKDEACNKLRAEIKKLEEDLAEAQKTEQSTKSRAASTNAEVEKEKARSARVAMELQSELRDNQTKKQESMTVENRARVDLEKSMGELHRSWNRCIEIQIKEGITPSPSHTDPRAVPPVLDLTDLKEQNSALQAEIAAETAKEEGHKKTINESRSMLSKRAEECKVIEAKAASIKETAEEILMTEKERSMHMEIHQKKLELARDDVSRLKESYTQLQQTKESEAKETVSLSSNKVGEAVAIQEKINSVRAEVARKVASIAEAAPVWETEKSRLIEIVAREKEEAELAKRSSESLDEESQQRQAEHREKMANDEQRAKEQAAEFQRKSEEKREAIFQRYPELRVYPKEKIDPSKDLEQLKEDLFSELISQWNEKVISAKASRAARDKERQEATRKAEAAAAEIQRKEEERRLQEKRLQEEKEAAARLAEIERRENEIKRERELLQAEREAAKKAKAEEEAAKARAKAEAEAAAAEAKKKAEAARTRAKAEAEAVKAEAKSRAEARAEADAKSKAKAVAEKEAEKLKLREEEENREERAAKLAASKQVNEAAGIVAKRRRKGADFFQPQSRGVREEDETPARPKTLLATFAQASEATTAEFETQASEDVTTGFETQASEAATTDFELGPSSQRTTDKKVTWDDEPEKTEEDENFEGSSSAEEEEEPVVPARSRRRRTQYGAEPKKTRGRDAILPEDSTEIEKKAKAKDRTGSRRSTDPPVTSGSDADARKTESKKKDNIVPSTGHRGGTLKRRSKMPSTSRHEASSPEKNLNHKSRTNRSPAPSPDSRSPEIGSKKKKKKMTEAKSKQSPTGSKVSRVSNIRSSSAKSRSRGGENTKGELVSKNQAKDRKTPKKRLVRHPTENLTLQEASPVSKPSAEKRKRDLCRESISRGRLKRAPDDRGTKEGISKTEKRNVDVDGENRVSSKRSSGEKVSESSTSKEKSTKETEKKQSDRGALKRASSGDAERRSSADVSSKRHRSSSKSDSASKSSREKKKEHSSSRSVSSQRSTGRSSSQHSVRSSSSHRKRQSDADDDGVSVKSSSSQKLSMRSCLTSTSTH